MWCSKSINFLLYQINLHALQSHTLQRHDTVFAHIHRTTATSLRMRCNSYTSHTYILQRHNSAFMHIHICVTVWCSKLISFDFLIDLHALQSHTLQRHDIIFAYIHRTTATSLRMRCNSYTSHTYTLQRHDSAFAYIHICATQ